MPRRNLLSRRAAGKREVTQAIAADVDAVRIVTALDADFSVRRIERYLTLAHQARAAPVVLLTKAAECADVPSYLEEARQVARAAPVHAVDVLAGLAADLPACLIVASPGPAVRPRRVGGKPRCQSSRHERSGAAEAGECNGFFEDGDSVCAP